MPPPPPKLAPKPGKVTVWRAKYPYTAQHADELSFDEGDMIYVHEQGQDGWWKATINGKSGLVPANYVEAEGNAEVVDAPLHEAAKRGNVSYLQECLANGVSVNALDKAGSTPLHWAARGGHVDCVKILLSTPNIKVDVQNKLGDTPLHNAAYKSHEEVVALLLEAGADRYIVNENNETPYALASDAGTARLLVIRNAPAAADEYADSNDEGEEPE